MSNKFQERWSEKQSSTLFENSAKKTLRRHSAPHRPGTSQVYGKRERERERKREISGFWRKREICNARVCVQVSFPACDCVVVCCVECTLSTYAVRPVREIFSMPTGRGQEWRVSVCAFVCMHVGEVHPERGTGLVDGVGIVSAGLYIAFASVCNRNTRHTFPDALFDDFAAGNCVFWPTPHRTARYRSHD
jgi:hypothetical protein